MARLSAPANETPKTERKSNRFRDIFKNRSGSSASSSPTVLSKLPPTIESSPSLPSPTVKPGFQQIGILPSEGSYSDLWKREDSQELGSNGSLGAVMEKDKKKFKRGKATSNVDCGLTHVDDEGRQPLVMEKQAQDLAQSWEGALLDRQREQAEYVASKGDASTTEGLGSPAGHTQNHASLPLGYSQRIMEAMQGMAQVLLHSVPNTNTTLGINAKPERDATLMDEDDHVRRRQSFASNIFDDDSSLSHGIREYVAIKISDALDEQLRKHSDQGEQRTSAPVHITVKIDMTGPARATNVVHGNTETPKSNLLADHSTLGPLKITHPSAVGDVQLGVIATYMLILLVTAFMGPKTLLLTLWKMGIVLAVYAVLVHHMGWNEDLDRDVLLAPVFFAGVVASDMGAELLGELGVIAVSVFEEALLRTASGVDVRVGSEGAS
ncbi:hypothetical protein BDW02DRAFT_615216 [Decorospora gaudefroyi]|uniref:Uncharacterized protein n=1 Tax=Decorospora gaudefroyi TaxID=184978 RepID=A0A6A5K2U2_9PLEO|nr:hypothetical protein BDW02DRAFT_615216 [Decorospora gaudefroyi]